MGSTLGQGAQWEAERGREHGGTGAWQGARWSGGMVGQGHGRMRGMVWGTVGGLAGRGSQWVQERDGDSHTQA